MTLRHQKTFKAMAHRRVLSRQLATITYNYPVVYFTVLHLGRE